MTIRLLDLGGSGVKTAKVDSAQLSRSMPSFTATHHAHPDWRDFVGWLEREGLLDADAFGIACAGFITRDGIVKLCRIAGWHDFPLAEAIRARVPGAQVFVLNDAEAHLLAHVDDCQLPLMTLALGTSPGFAIANRQGQLVRALDDLNFDIGEMTLATSASKKQVWWALGTQGLAELQEQRGEEAGASQFGYRLGTLLATLCGLFHPKTIILSGGITARWWDTFHPNLQSEFLAAKPAWVGDIALQRSPYAKQAALVGMARSVAKQINL